MRPILLSQLRLPILLWHQTGRLTIDIDQLRWVLCPVRAVRKQIAVRLFTVLDNVLGSEWVIDLHLVPFYSCGRALAHSIQPSWQAPTYASDRLCHVSARPYVTTGVSPGLFSPHFLPRGGSHMYLESAQELARSLAAGSCHRAWCPPVHKRNEGRPSVRPSFGTRTRTRTSR